MPNKIEHKVSLSKLHYESTGIAVPREGVDLFIPYEKIQIKPTTGCMLVHLAGNFKADLSMLLRVTQKTGEVEGVDIEANNEGLLELNNAIKCITVFRKKIEVLVAERSLTIQKARDILAGLDYQIESDECLNQLLVQIVADFSPHRITEEFIIPLEKLNYSLKGVSFSYERARYHIPANLVSGLELRPRFNLIRDRMKGKATFTRYNETLFRWDPDSSNLVVGETKDNIISGHIRIRNPKATKRACYEEIIASFNRYKVRSLKRLERLLAHWGLSPDDREAGLFIAPRLTPLIEPNLVYPVCLKEIHFFLKRIRVPLDGVELDIPSTKFTFKTSTVFNRVKPVLKVFTHDIHVRLDKTRAFEWDDEKKSYQIGAVKYVVHGVNIDRYVKGQLSRIYNLHVVVKAPPVTPIKSPRKRKKGTKRPPMAFTNEYIQALEGMAEEIYFARGGYWFHVKKTKPSRHRLIWEVKRDNLATYIFKWPGKNGLVSRVQDILAMPRRDLFNNPKIGFLGRVLHPRGDFDKWKDDVEQTL